MALSRYAFRVTDVSATVSDDPTTAARDYLRTEHGDLIAAVDACADAVADSWDGATVADGSRVSAPLRACLDQSGALDAFPRALAGAVDAAGRDLQATPVAGPPYVVVTSRGPVLRATLPDGRLVVRFDVFYVTADNEYTRGPSGEDALDVSLR